MAHQNRLTILVCGLAFLVFIAFPACFLVGGSGVLEAAAADPPSSAPDSIPVDAPSSGDVGRGPDSGDQADCREILTLLRQQQSLISRETAQLKRELAALRQDISKPGVKEVFAGIGYIFGLAGVGLYVQSRKRPDRSD